MVKTKDQQKSSRILINRDPADFCRMCGCVSSCSSTETRHSGHYKAQQALVQCRIRVYHGHRSVPQFEWRKAFLCFHSLCLRILCSTITAAISVQPWVVVHLHSRSPLKQKHLVSCCEGNYCIYYDTHADN